MVYTVSEVREAYFDACARFYARIGERSTRRNYTPIWDGGESSDGRMHQPVWPKIIAYAVKHKVSPIALIQAGIEGWRGPKPPEPPRMCSDWALSIVKDLKKNQTAEILERFQADNTSAAMYYTTYKARGNDDLARIWREVVFSRETGISVLHRYCIAFRAGFKDLADDLEDLAFKQYLYAPDIYNEVWAHWIPDHFKEKTAELSSTAAVVN